MGWSCHGADARCEGRPERGLSSRTSASFLQVFACCWLDSLGICLNSTSYYRASGTGSRVEHSRLPFHLQPPSPSHMCSPSLPAFTQASLRLEHTLSLLCLANLASSSRIPQVSCPWESLTGQCLLPSMLMVGVGEPLCLLPSVLFDSLTHSAYHTVLMSWPSSLNRLNTS